MKSSKPRNKYTKGEADYGEGSKTEHCAICKHFEVYEPHKCETVEGKISPQAWCKYFAKKPKKWSALTKTHI